MHYKLAHKPPHNTTYTQANECLTARKRVQASLLAQHDNWSPCIIVAAASVVSLLSDVTLIVYFRLGLTGAAVSTVVTQYLGLAALIHACMRPGRLTPTLPNFPFRRIAASRAQKMIPKLPWPLATTKHSSHASRSVDGTVVLYEQLCVGSPCML
jgi:Na+-driven multidrug efflux pump